MTGVELAALIKEQIAAHGPASASALAKAVAVRKRAVLELLGGDDRFEMVGRGRACRWRLAADHADREPDRESVPADTVAGALDRELGELERRDAGLGRSSLAASARVLAAKLDDPSTSATAAASSARQLRELLAELERRAPKPPAAGGTLETIRARVASRARKTPA